MIAVVWKCEVRPEHGDEFERLFGTGGEWTALSRRSRSYLGSSFLKDLANPRQYLLIEYWSEMLVYERHQEGFRDDIGRLDELRSTLLVSSTPLGIFNALDVPDRTGPTWSRRRGRGSESPD